MPGRYVISVAHARAMGSDDPEGSSRRGALSAWERVFDRSGVTVFIAQGTPYTVGANGSWLAIGHLFERRPGRSASPCDAATLDELAVGWWGGFVAIELANDAATGRVLRDPSGTLACWMVRGSRGTVFTNDLGAGLAMAETPRPTVAVDPVAQTLLYPDLRGPLTALSGIEEVQPGTVRTQTSGRAWQTAVAWSPWPLTAPDRRIDDADRAASIIRREVDRAVAAWRATMHRPLVELSGGLDSSIVAACLAAHGPVAAATLVTPGPDGDERRYARLVAEATGMALYEGAASADMIDVVHSAAAGLPRPASRAFAQAADRVFLDAASDADADAFFSGGGGDNVFAFYHSALPAADRLRTAGPSARALATIVDAATLIRRSAWQGGRRAVDRAWLHRRLPLWPSDRSLLAPAVADLSMPEHPWVTPPTDVLPGKHWHVRSLITIQNHLDGFARGDRPMIFPLLSQPVVEAALRIPSWRWIEGGRDRAVARRAFADRLPTAIVQRRTKGGLDSLADAIIARQGATIRAMLLDGWLTGAGIIDRPAVEAAFTERDRAQRRRLLALLDVEAWARYWS